MNLGYKAIDSNIKKLYERLGRNPHAKFLGLDMGKRKIGLAIGFLKKNIVLPNTVIMRSKVHIDINKILKILEQFEIEDVVIGLPLQDNELSKHSKYILDFAEALNQKESIVIYFQDESFSTNEAIEKLQGLSIIRKKREQVDDAIAAAIILQDFFRKIINFEQKFK